MADNKTYYTPENLDKAMELIKEAKNIMVKAQDFDGAVFLRNTERHLVIKQESDKNRTI